MTRNNTTTQRPGMVRFFTKLFHIILYIPIQILFMPFALIGLIIAIYKEMGNSKKLGISYSAVKALQYRWMMHYFNTRPDPLVLPGAGFDLTALHFTQGKHVKVFELDQVKTLNVKVETLNKAGIPHDWITYIPVDYAHESWAKKLVEAGFDTTKKTLFLWQSVSLYVDAAIVKETLREMADLCAEGSIVAQDFYSKTSP